MERAIKVAKERKAGIILKYNACRVVVHVGCVVVALVGTATFFSNVCKK